jgi:hypothetical protein
MDKIGILYIGIGRYADFWHEFHETCEKNFLTDAVKHYFVFTDKDDTISGERVYVFHQDDMGWPCNTLLRFKMFSRIENKLQDYDYLFFFNSNAIIVKPVLPEDILPVDEDFSAVCVEDNPEKMSFEPRPVSAAFVSRDEAKYYFAGGLNGGKRKAYLDLIASCNHIVDTDIQNGIMPLWHDESVLNRYLLGKRVKIMYRDMMKPANWKKPKNAKIILRKKENVLGRSWLRQYKGREHTQTWLRKLWGKLRGYCQL